MTKLGGSIILLFFVFSKWHSSSHIARAHRFYKVSPITYGYFAWLRYFTLYDALRQSFYQVLVKFQAFQIESSSHEKDERVPTYF
jgi:hypothetical protein